MSKTISREQYLKAYEDAPEIVRAAYDADSTTQVIVGLKDKFQLHLDSAGAVGQAVGYVLLGLMNPQEFLNELVDAKIPDADARAIMIEVNQKIFMPLREQMMKGPTATSVSAKPVVSAPVEIKPPQAQAPIVPVKPPEPAPAIPRLVVPTAPAPLRPEVRPVPRPSVAPSGVGPVAPKVEPPAAPEKFFHLQNKIPPAPTAPRPPAPSLREVLAAVTAEKQSPAPVPPANLPGALPPVAASKVEAPTLLAPPAGGPKVEPPVPSVPPAPPAPPKSDTPPVPPPAKPYSVDPYREPIE